MSKDENKKKKQKAQGDKPQNNVVSFQKLVCSFDACSMKVRRFGFCEEHFDHFKYGLIRKDGSKPPDYNEKFKHYMKQLGKTPKAA